MGAATIAAGCGAGSGQAFGALDRPGHNIPLYVACATLPAYAVAQTQGGIARIL